MKIVLTPDWFLGFDVLIELFSFIVLVIFLISSIQNYRMNKNKKNFLYIGIGFGLIALAQLATILTKTVLYYDFNLIRQVGQAIITSNFVSSVDIFYYIGFFFYKFLTLVGFYIIYRLHSKRTYLGESLLFGYFILISALLSTEIYYLFHLTCLGILLLIMRNYYGIYKENHFLNTKILLIAFGILSLSQILFIFPNGALQATANIVELISYTLLLFLAIKIGKNGKKKKSDGDNIRYAGGNPSKRRKH
ncbi:MAG: hypothetical protein AABY15_08435 [Nanoarchaeota archaeon]